MSASYLLTDYLQTAQAFYAAVEKLATHPQPEAVQ
jgi:hypothetical protein